MSDETTCPGPVAIVDVQAEAPPALLRLRRLSGMDGPTAASFVRDQVVAVGALFEEMPAPYPGRLTHTVGCPASFRPTFRAQEDARRAISEFRILASTRFSYGVCAADLAAYRAVLAFVECKASHDVYRLELFFPKDARFDEILARDLLDTFVC